MALAFYEIILPEQYAPQPQGGPEHSNSVYTVPASGVEDINRNRPTALHRYVIPYELLDNESMKWLHSHFLIVGGIGGAFRMSAPEAFNRVFEGETMQGTVGGGNTVFKLVKTHTVTAASYYGGATHTYTQRIVKPDYDGGLEIYVGGSLVDLEADGTMDWTTGTFTFDVAPGAAPVATGKYHLPVRFTEDWFNPTMDTSGGHGGIGLKEVLPKTIGID